MARLTRPRAEHAGDQRDDQGGRPTPGTQSAWPSPNTAFHSVTATVTSSANKARLKAALRTGVRRQANTSAAVPSLATIRSPGFAEEQAHDEWDLAE